MFEFMPGFSGPEFLLFYIGLFAACLIGGKLMKNMDGTADYRMPGPTQFSPQAMAALAGGTGEVLRTTLFSMIEAKVLSVAGRGPLAMVQRADTKKTPLPDPVENQIYESLKSPRTPAALFSDRDLLAMIDIHLSPVYREFESLRIMQDSGDRTRIRLVTWAAVATLAVFGALRMVHGISKGKPVGFLVVLLAVFTLVLYAALKLRPHERTRLGEKYLAKMKDHFGWLTESFKTGDSPEGIDPALALSLFGPGLFAGLPAYAHLSPLFTVPAFGAHDGGRSSGDSGGGCSSGCGGGGCGGGCGGCS